MSKRFPTTSGFDSEFNVSKRLRTDEKITKNEVLNDNIELQEKEGNKNSIKSVSDTSKCLNSNEDVTEIEFLKDNSLFVENKQTKNNQSDSNAAILCTVEDVINNELLLDKTELKNRKSIHNKPESDSNIVKHFTSEYLTKIEILNDITLPRVKEMIKSDFNAVPVVFNDENIQNKEPLTIYLKEINKKPVESKVIKCLRTYEDIIANDSLNINVKPGESSKYIIKNSSSGSKFIGRIKNEQKHRLQNYESTEKSLKTYMKKGKLHSATNKF